MSSQTIKASLLGAALMFVGVVLGCFLMGTIRGDVSAASHLAAFAGFEETLLHASSATSGDQFAMATGAIDDESEGIFVLDYVTGVLKCAVLNQRTGKFAALFTANVTSELGASKNPKYEMVAGLVNFTRGTTPRRPGLSVVYVLDATTGKLIAYSIPWKREAAATGRPQIGELQPIDGMQIRE